MNPRHSSIDSISICPDASSNPGKPWLSTTVPRGKVVLRMYLINPRTSLKDHVFKTSEILELYAEKAARETSR
jgi:hypothetical protein